MTLATDRTPADVNPWRTIWFAPRTTMRQLIATEARPSWVPVVALIATRNALSLLVALYPFTTTADITGDIVALVVSVGAGLLILFVVAPFLLAFVGRKLGGHATPSGVRDALAWSHIPVAVTVLCWVPFLFLFGVETFNPISATERWSHIVLLRLVPSMALLWSSILAIGATAEVHGFSVLRALATSIIVNIPLLVLTGLMATAME